MTRPSAKYRDAYVEVTGLARLLAQVRWNERLGLCASLLEAGEFLVEHKHIFADGNTEIGEVSCIVFGDLFRSCMSAKVSAFTKCLIPTVDSIVDDSVFTAFLESARTRHKNDQTGTAA